MCGAYDYTWMMRSSSTWITAAAVWLFSSEAAGIFAGVAIYTLLVGYDLAHSLVLSSCTSAATARGQYVPRADAWGSCRALPAGLQIP